MIWATKGKRLVLMWDWSRQNGWRDRATPKSLAVFDAWDRAQRKAHGWRRSLSGLRRTNQAREWMIVARHWPHKLCWDWFLSVSWEGWRDTSGLKLIADRRLGQITLVLVWVVVRFHWQRSGYMVQRRGGAEAPKIVWSHHLTHMEPMGSA